MSTRKRKLIEVALPLAEISRASQADKDRKVGTIKNLHKWFAPMPTPALRALIFASLVDDPADENARENLLELIKDLVPDNGMPPRQDVIENAIGHIRACNPQLPTVVDPFAGSGSTLVEAQRLGLPALGFDYNPVAALISRTLVEVLPPMAQAEATAVPGMRLSDQPYDAFSDDLRHYAGLVQDVVEERLGWMYPRPAGGEPVAWLWARTAPCANPVCGLEFPLFGSPWLSKQKGREASISTVVENGQVRFVVHIGKQPTASPTKGAGRATFICPNPSCRTPRGEKDLRKLGETDRLGLQLITLCVDTSTGRTFVDASDVELPPEDIPIPEDLDDLEIGKNRKNFSPPLYGLTHHKDLYTRRQRAILAAFADEVGKVPERVITNGGSEEQGRAIATVLGLCVSKLAQANSTLVRWRTRTGPSKPEPAFGTQAMPMLWDFAECYPFGQSVGSWSAQVSSMIGVLKTLPTHTSSARITQGDARTVADNLPAGTVLLVTDPPYFGQINYADLSDYFYIWLRRALAKVHPDLFSTIATPKSDELTANPVRHEGNKDAARQYFIDGFTQVFSSAKAASRPDLPIVVAYAQKQAEETANGVVSTAWEALLEAILASGLGVVGTWPVEATLRTRQVGQGANALSSYVILVCRPSNADRSTIDRRGFIAALKSELPLAIRELQMANIPPIDLGQAAIGPGMAVLSRYARVIEADGSSMTVRTALELIDQALSEILYQQEGASDSDTRFCFSWFTRFGWDEAESGRADQLSRSTNTSVDGLVSGGVFWARAGKARLLGIDDLTDPWDPIADERVSVWEVVLRLAKALNEQGIEAAGSVFAGASRRVDVDTAKELAYLLFNVCERKGWTETAILFNNVVTSWMDLEQAARRAAAAGPAEQRAFDFDDEEF